MISASNEAGDGGSSARGKRRRFETNVVFWGGMNGVCLDSA
jgi:hypothetical protein